MFIKFSCPRCGEKISFEWNLGDFDLDTLEDETDDTDVKCDNCGWDGLLSIDLHFDILDEE